MLNSLSKRAVCHAVVALLSFSFFAAPGLAQEEEPYDYHAPADMIVTMGRQALMICNGLFVSDRTLEQIYEQELKLYRQAVLPPSNVKIDHDRRTVEVGGGGSSPIPVMRAVYREGLGAIILAPDQTLEDVEDLPVLNMPPQAGDASQIAWPDGDLVTKKNLPEGVSPKAVQAASDWAFNRSQHGAPTQITLSLLVVYQGEIVHERYAPDVDYTTKTRTWSTAKSIASTLIGIAVDQGRLQLDAPLPFKIWAPTAQSTKSVSHPRAAITLRNALHMSSGLYPVDNEKCHVVGSCLSYWAGASAARGALDRGLVQRPGTHWDYENYDTILAVLALKNTFDSLEDYHQFPRRALFDKIGMRNTVPGVDRFGDFILSSQVYTNARDLARLGLLYLKEGVWNDEQILSQNWVNFSRTPASSTQERGRFYGAQWWLVPDERSDVPQDAYSTAGHRGQFTVVVPSYDLVIVRRGLDWMPSEHRFSQWDLTREVLKAFAQRPWGKKPKSLTNGHTQK